MNSCPKGFCTLDGRYTYLYMDGPNIRAQGRYCPVCDTLGIRPDRDTKLVLCSDYCRSSVVDAPLSGAERRAPRG